MDRASATAAWRPDDASRGRCSDVSTLFTLFSDPAVTAYMAPPPPTLAKFAGFVVWSHQEREQGHGLCFAIVPEGMTAAVGILQVRSLDPTLSSAEWGLC